MQQAKVVYRTSYFVDSKEERGVAFASGVCYPNTIAVRVLMANRTLSNKKEEFSREEIYARRRIEDSPLKLRRENSYDLCQCGHTRQNHMSHCFHHSCVCKGFKQS